MKSDLTETLHSRTQLTARQQIQLIWRLSLPAIFAQLSSILMQYIDASMVGRLGESDAASIGLIASSTWLMGGLCSAFCTGFTILVAQRIGAGDTEGARSLVRTGLISTMLFSGIMAVLGAAISSILPFWLGGSITIHAGATRYFLICSLSMPLFQLDMFSCGMLESSGNMRLPSILQMLMCLLDVAFNALLIFPSRTIILTHAKILIPGAGLGITGAALGTTCAEAVTAGLMAFFLLCRSPSLHLRAGEKLHFQHADFSSAVKLSLPVAAEEIVLCGAQIASTRIVAPLGTAAIAANSFAVTAESLCYMPGYGIASAASTITGQCTGAGRRKLAVQMGWLTTGLGMTVMATSGILMYIFAPQMIGILSPEASVRQLGTAVLRIEAFAEPLFAASIVAAGVLRGAGDTLVPSIMNFCSMWLVRLPLAAFLAPRFGLRGVWIAMCIELCFRGTLFLIRLAGKQWHSQGNKADD